LDFNKRAHNSQIESNFTTTIIHTDSPSTSLFNYVGGGFDSQSIKMRHSGFPYDASKPSVQSSFSHAYCFSVSAFKVPVPVAIGVEVDKYTMATEVTYNLSHLMHKQSKHLHKEGRSWGRMRL
jgi:hypothetical protein